MINKLEKEVTINGKNTNAMVFDSETGELLGEGNAVCDKHDKYDANVGIEIATQRAYIQARSNEWYEKNTLVRKLQMELSILKSEMDKLENEVIHRKERLEDVINSTMK